LTLRVAFITNELLLERATGLFSPLASVRREIILPARALSEHGVLVHVISLPAWPADQVRDIVNKADRVVFGKLLMTAGETALTAFATQAQAYRQVLREGQAAGRSVFCFADDHFNFPEFARFYRETAPGSRAWIASSETLKDRLQLETQSPVFAYPEVAEAALGIPRTPRRGLRERIGVWLARRSRVGLDPWRLKLLWFGHPSNVVSVLRLLPELEDFGKRTPILLECITRPGTQLDDKVAASETQSAGLRIISSPWSLDYMPSAFEQCDAVILPQLAEDPQKRAKSNNRLVDAIQAGRFAVAHPIPSYAELREFCWVGESIREGLHWLVRHPAEALRRLIAGQAHVARYHSPKTLADFWLRALDFSA
jgi:hypothetical protein